MPSPSRFRTLALFVVPAMLLAAIGGVLLWLSPALGATPPDAVALPPQVVAWGFGAAAVATGLSALAAGYAVAAVGSAGIGALAERPELMGRVLVMVGLAEGIAIYGLIVSILILNRLG